MNEEELKNRLQNRINATIECIIESAYKISERNNDLIGQLETLSYMLFLKEEFGKG